MDHVASPKKEHKGVESSCKKTEVATATAECETICREMLKCIKEPATQPKVDVPPKKERELLEGVTEYFIFWN